jgi:spermidine/putrescine transport system permease protein
MRDADLAHARAGQALQRGRASRWLIGGASLASYFLLWVPLIIIALYSFNAARAGTQWQGFTLEWYRRLGENSAALLAARNTIVLATASTAISTILGTLLGYGLGRRPVSHRGLGESLFQLPILVPDVVFAVALLLFFAVLRRWLPFFELGLGTMIVGHVSLQVPFVALVVRARARGLDPALDEAARDLGAGPLRAFWHVTLPLLRPGIAAGALLALTLSLDDFAVSFFTAGPGSTTLPILIYASARRGITPEINALSTLMIVATVFAVLAMRWVRGTK